tara:strand:+ start:447 stop:557 length:111 start_codon:yes stop_codon:yes gene_type:complete
MIIIREDNPILKKEYEKLINATTSTIIVIKIDNEAK